jgi:LPXTG-site transpeptidase (sortase) family protein
MAKTKQAKKHRLAGKDWRRSCSDLLILAGALLLFCAALSGVKTALAAQRPDEQNFLVSSIDLPLPLPTLTSQPVAAEVLAPTPVEAAQPTPAGEFAPPPTQEPEPTPAAPESQGLVENALLYLPFVSNAEPLPVQEQTAAAMPQPPVEPQFITQSSGPVIRLEIPRLKVDRAVVTIDLIKKAGGELQWNTDSLFANANRPDLVGQLATSVNPGDGGNIILVGHNYNNGWNWAGVFVNVDKLQPGDKILLRTENGGAFEYDVQKVKKVPWTQQNSAELEKHAKYMWPTASEQLTLVTCGGSYLMSWTARIYVVAIPASPPQ